MLEPSAARLQLEGRKKEQEVMWETISRIFSRERE